MILEFLVKYQVFIIFAASVFSFLLAIYAGVIPFRSRKKKSILVFLALSLAVLTFFDAFTYISQGRTTKFWITMGKVSNFFAFEMILFSVYEIVRYISSVVVETGKLKETPIALKMCELLPIIGTVLLIISQFNGMYYYLDAMNMYIRGSYFHLSFICPFGTIIFLLIYCLRHKDLVKINMTLSIAVFTLLPLLTTFIQMYIKGLSLINFGVFMAVLVFFWQSLVDLNFELVEVSNTDRDMNILNTYGLIDEIAKIMKANKASEFNVYYFDVKKMGSMNQKYGRDKADEILKLYVKNIKANLDSDEKIARHNGDFFGAIVKRIHNDKFLSLMNSLDVEVEIDGKNEIVKVSAAVGGYELKNNKETPPDVIDFTSEALIYAQNNELDYAFLNDELKEKIAEEKRIEEDIKNAIKNQEFEPFFQPKVDSNTQTLSGAEALARWKKGDTYIPPYKFIPVMERNDSVCELDFIIFEKTCANIKEWLDRGIDVVPVSLNFSRRHLKDKDLTNKIDNTIKKYGIDKSYIQVEITETIDEFTTEDLKALVNHLHERGIKVAIDDFGTGSSTIALLNEIDFDVIKIDKAFVDQEDEKGKTILSSIIRLTNDLKLNVLAEGVEEIRQLKVLREMGCYEIQGYLYDKPLPKEEFEKRLLNKIYTLESKCDKD